MSRTLVWDIPTRLFHWLLVGGFVVTAVISLLLGEDSALFPYHAIIGLSLALMICLRIVWGIVGSRYARFRTFTFGPAAVIEYMKGVFSGGGKRHIGHNPGSAYAIFAMLALLLGLAVTGIMMGQGNESVEEIHEVLAYVMVGVVIAHILGVAVHTIRLRENIVASMIHGKKNAQLADGIGSSHSVAAVIFLVIAGAWSVGLVRNYDPTTQTTRLPVLGTAVQIGEAENEGGREHGGDNERHDDDDD